MIKELAYTLKLKKLVYTLKSIFVSLFSPNVCVLCGRFIGNVGLSIICQSCLGDITFIDRISDSKVCEKCSLPYYGSSCPDCADLNMNFDKLLSLFLYEGIGQKVIYALKFGGKFAILKNFKDAIKEKLSSLDFDVIVPVPSDIDKFVKRGYNPSFFISSLISEIFGKKVLNILRKNEVRPSQLELSREERLKNPRGAFALVDYKIGRGGGVLIVDDVATTCSTLSECARVIRGYFDRIYAFTLARAPRFEKESLNKI